MGSGSRLVGLATAAAIIAAALLLGPTRRIGEWDVSPPFANESRHGITAEHSTPPEGRLVLQIGTGGKLLSSEPRGEVVLGPGVSIQDISSDGSKLLAEKLGTYADGKFRARQLVVIDVETGQRSVAFEAPPDQSLGHGAKWSPDGTMVAYKLEANDAAERSTLCVLLPSETTSCFPETGHVYTFDWSPDGTNILVAGPGSQPVQTVDVRTGDMAVVVRQEGDTPINEALLAAGIGEVTQLVGPTWSPSGRYLGALANLNDSSCAYVPVVFTPDGEVVTLGRPSKEFPAPFGWSPGMCSLMRGELSPTALERRTLSTLPHSMIDSC